MSEGALGSYFIIYLQCDINAVIKRDCVLLCPSIVKKVQHDLACFVPDEPVILLKIARDQGKVASRMNPKTHIRKRRCTNLPVALPLFAFRSHYVPSKEIKRLVVRNMFRPHAPRQRDFLQSRQQREDVIVIIIP